MSSSGAKGTRPPKTDLPAGALPGWRGNECRRGFDYAQVN